MWFEDLICAIVQWYMWCDWYRSVLKIRYQETESERQCKDTAIVEICYLATTRVSRLWTLYFVCCNYSNCWSVIINCSYDWWSFNISIYPIRNPLIISHVTRDTWQYHETGIAFHARENNLCGLHSRRRSKWWRGLRHELSSLIQTLGSWVRIPLKAWLSVCIYSVFVLSCVGSGLATDWSSNQGVLPTVLGLRNLSETKRFTDTLCSNVGATGNKREKRVSPRRNMHVIALRRRTEPPHLTTRYAEMSKQNA
jgi:hypothetical protein